MSQAIDSVGSQTYGNVEHLIIEGQSRGSSPDAIHQAQPDRMVMIGEPDKGNCDALNKGLQNASSDVVGRLHSDDFLAHETALVRIARAFEEPAVEAVFSDLGYVPQADTTRVTRRGATGLLHPQCRGCG